LRLQGEAFEGKLDWLVGGYYANEKLRVDDNLSYGEDYDRFANCLVAVGSFASFLQPSNPTCINQVTAQGAFNAGLIPPASRLLFAAFSRINGTLLGVPDFTAANFSNSGFSNLAEVFGLPNQTLNGQAIDDSWRQSSNNWALFTHNIFDITDQFSLTVGARYTHEKKTLRADLNDTNNLCTFFAASPLAARITVTSIRWHFEERTARASKLSAPSC
jgi:hypothetical protein